MDDVTENVTLNVRFFAGLGYTTPGTNANGFDKSKHSIGLIVKVLKGCATSILLLGCLNLNLIYFLSYIYLKTS